MIRYVAATIAAVAIGMMPIGAAAQDKYPSKIIHIVVGVAPGGLIDVTDGPRAACRPGRRSRCWAGCCSRSPTHADRLRLRLRGLHPGRGRGARRGRRPGAGLRAACWPRSPARCRPSRSTWRSIGPKVTISCGSARFTLPTDAGRGLPHAAADADHRRRRSTAPRSPTAVAQIAVAAGRDDTLPMLTGIRVEIEGDELTLAATDRFRLAVRELAWKPEQTELSTAVLIPARTLADVGEDARRRGGHPGVGRRRRRRGHARPRRPAARRTTIRLLDVEFPKYRSLLPTEHTTTVDIPVSALLRGDQAGRAGHRPRHARAAAVRRRLADADRRRRRRGSGRGGARRLQFDGDAAD